MASLPGYPQHSAVEAIFCCFQVIITPMAGVGKLTLPSTVGAFSRIFAFEHPSSHLAASFTHHLSIHYLPQTLRSL